MMASLCDQQQTKALICFFIVAYKDIFKWTDPPLGVAKRNNRDRNGFCWERIRYTFGVMERQIQESTVSMNDLSTN